MPAIRRGLVRRTPIRAYALMIRAGIPIGALQPYLRQRAWLIDAARHLRRTPEDLAAEMIGTMLRSGAIVRRDQRIHAAADYVPVVPDPLAGANNPTDAFHQGAARPGQIIRGRGRVGRPG
jgi:hypothetical protein